MHPSLDRRGGVETGTFGVLKYARHRRMPVMLLDEGLPCLGLGVFSRTGVVCIHCTPLGSRSSSLVCCVVFPWSKDLYEFSVEQPTTTNPSRLARPLLRVWYAQPSKLAP